MSAREAGAQLAPVLENRCIVGSVTRATIIALGLLLAAAPARADELAECNDALVRGQEHMRAGRVLEARAAFPGCLRASCNIELRAVCSNFLAQVTRAVPTLRIRVRDASGENVQTAHVEVDGISAGDGNKAVEVNPGAHIVRVTAARYVGQSTSVDVREGERVVDVTLALAPETASPPGTREAVPTRPNVLPWIFGGVAVVAAGSFAFFALDGKGTEHDLREQCPRGPCDTTPMRRAYLIADVSAIVALVSGGVAAFTALSTPSRPER